MVRYPVGSEGNAPRESDLRVELDRIVDLEERHDLLKAEMQADQERLFRLSPSTPEWGELVDVIRMKKQGGRSSQRRDPVPQNSGCRGAGQHA